MDKAEVNEKPVVLMVDDDREYRNLARVKFEEVHGHHFLEAESFEKAVLLIPTISRRCVAFVDIHLAGGKSGLDLLAWIQENVPHLVVPYCLTGSDSLTVMKKALDAGAFDVFDKNMQLRKECGYDLWDILALRAETKFVKRLLSRAWERRLPDFWNLEAFRRQVEPKLEAAAPREGEWERRDVKRFQQFALLFIEVANWKAVTMSPDLTKGDQVAEKAADVIKNNVRPTDHLCRMGDDEFVAMLPDVAESRAFEIADSIRRATLSANFSGDTQVKISIKVGLDHVDRSGLSGNPSRDLDSMIYNARSNRV